MALSRLAQQFADEIRQHDWSDSPWRLDRAGHSWDRDSNRGPQRFGKPETDTIRTNVMWATAQVLGYNDPNFDVFEFAEACGVDTRTPSGQPRSGYIPAGLRGGPGRYQRPGTYEFDEDQKA